MINPVRCLFRQENYKTKKTTMKEKNVFHFVKYTHVLKSEHSSKVILFLLILFPVITSYSQKSEERFPVENSNVISSNNKIKESDIKNSYSDEVFEIASKIISLSSSLTANISKTEHQLVSENIRNLFPTYPFPNCHDFEKNALLNWITNHQKESVDLIGQLQQYLQLESTKH